MVKKPNVNNMPMIFQGDDADAEPQDSLNSESKTSSLKTDEEEKEEEENDQENSESESLIDGTYQPKSIQKT